MSYKRRTFLKTALAGAGALAVAHYVKANYGSIFTFFSPVNVENPLAYYPNRDWERTYRNLWNYDSEFTFLCAPNDTHNCLLQAHVKNGTMVRIAPSFNYNQAADLYGNTPSARWEPRCCQKGLALIRRFYGDRRIKFPVVRQGFLQWIHDGFPREADGKPAARYVEGRGKEPFVKITWEQAFEYTARVFQNIAENYSGDKGRQFLEKQGYDPLMIEAAHGIGTQVLKLRGGMPALGVTRIFGMKRLANSLALLDAHIRKADAKDAKGARCWDSYAWHTDLPPGHPMVTGQQTVDWDLVCVEHTKHVVIWGMNWITTKMPDAHWLTEARMKGAKVTVIACEYSATCNKGDNVLVVRPGVTPALALGFIHVIISEKLYDADYVKKYTDLPLLVRLDTQRMLKPEDVIANYKPANVENYLKVMKEGEKPPASLQQGQAFVSEKLQSEWGDFMMWDANKNQAVTVTRDDYGKRFSARGINPALEGSFKIKTVDGREVEVRPVFDLVKQYVIENFDPATVEEITWAPKDGIIAVAREIAKNSGSTLFAMGMGPNQFFNNDLKDRTVLLLAALTRNIGRVGGNVGSYAGNYRAAFFSGLPTYIFENPFNIQLDEMLPAEVKKYVYYESAHFFNNTDRILRVGNKVLTGNTHVPTPTKAILVSNGNSLLGNAKGHYENVINAYPKVEFIGVCDWWWTGSCEYADIVFAIDSWAELKIPDATMSVTNPFLYIFPRTPLPRIFNTRGDMEVLAGIAKALGEQTGDKRFHDYFKFVHDGKPEVYLQRIFNSSVTTSGFKVADLEAKAQKGIPALLMSRTYPKFVGFEQSQEDKLWYTKSGRMEFYRDEPEFRASGENIPVFREPVDSTFYEPNVIVSKKHPVINPETPDKYGVPENDLSTDVRQGRHVVKSWDEVKKTTHPLAAKDSRYRFIFHTPKYRHGAHTTPVDTDVVAMWFGPFSDIYRYDKRKPFVTEMYMDINPLDAKELGIEDGDYVWVDADPEDRPFRGWQNKKDKPEYKLARMMCRARYYPGTPRGVTRMWHNVYAATYGSIKGAEENPTGLAKNPHTGYQAMFRFGSHQSCTRAWLKPTLLTDTLVRKNNFGQVIDKGFEVDVHGATGNPREAFVKIELAEKGGVGGKGLWEGAVNRIRPTYESEEFRRFMKGNFVSI
ncbi:MAG TPA: molybdopterin-dependent oxidoreductase [Chitinophagales bacterium]|nr:molybdopterin-dependent oxidoreductase [Chitinophagales bacterium]